MNRSLRNISTRKTSQRTPIPGRPDMVENYAGGYGWEVDDWMKLRRWCVLGSQGGTYYVGEQELTQENCDAAIRLIKSDGVKVVEAITEISTSGRAPQNDYALFVLAMCASLGDVETKRAAFAAVPKVARIGTHLMHFIKFAEQFRGWGRGLKGAIANWYGEKTPRNLVYQVLKYQSRDGWSQRDILRSSHPRPVSDVYDFIYRYITHGVREPLFTLSLDSTPQGFDSDYDSGGSTTLIRNEFGEHGIEFAGNPLVKRVSDSEWQVRDYEAGKVRQSFCLKMQVETGWDVYEDALALSVTDVHDKVTEFKEHEIDMIEGFEKAKRATSVPEIVKLVEDYNLPRECIPTQFLREKDVWKVLLTAGSGMPMTAMIRNLGNMSKSGLLVEGAFDTINFVKDRVTNQEILKRARVHPLAVLAALNTYQTGHGYRGSGEWPVVGDVVDALDSAFYLAFDNVTPTNQNICIGIDVSGSMSGGEINGIPGMVPRMAACALAMVTYKVEPNVAVMAFSDTFERIDMSRQQRLVDLMEHTARMPFRGTDCALPMLWAIDQYKLNPDIVFDAFVIYTDNETWFGNVHPCQALDQYRRLTNRPARLVTVGMTAAPFTIADPEDSGTLDCVGMSTSTPQIISDFLLGEL